MNIIDITGDIYPEHVNYVQYALGSNKDDVRCSISSRGGDFIAALAIYNMLRESGKRITTAAQGVCVSAGAVILLAGDEIEAAENSVIMFHSPMSGGMYGAKAEDLEKMAEQLKVMEKVLCTTLCRRTGWKEQDAKDFLAEEKYLTAQGAKKMGIIDKILPFVRRKVAVDNKFPVEIVNFVEEQNKEIDRMNLKEILGKLSITVIDTATEEQMVTSLVEHVTNLDTKLQSVVAELEEAKKLIPQKVNLPPAILGILKRSREGEIKSLASQGKITPVVAADLTNTFASDTHIGDHVNADGVITDTFDSVINAIGKNESVISFGGAPNVEVLDKRKEVVNPLVANAEARAAAAKK